MADVYHPFIVNAVAWFVGCGVFYIAFKLTKRYRIVKKDD